MPDETPSPDTGPASPAARLRARYGGDTPLLPPPAWSAVVEAQLRHRSVRAYLPDPVPDDVLTTLVAAAQSAATSGNLQLWSVVAVRDADRRARLAALAGGQRHIEQAPLLLVWLADLARARTIAAERTGETAGADYLESTIVAFVDAALAAQNAALAAESLGLGTVYIGALRNRPAEVAEELGLPPHVVAVFGLVVGRPDPVHTTPVKPRLPQEVVLHRERYSADGTAEQLTGYDRLLTEFYADEGLAGSWAERVAARFGSVEGLHGRHLLREALQERGFPLR
ncbi:NADPH-dependent oxidoreductase [Pseudonocardia kongjuensis]|uniref:NADPH-dependent oxidoreductase n=1 Tax=Pseudonocardia kongjuensis TaxID=102227 RepID=A0ABP4IPI0_9PSEU